VGDMIWPRELIDLRWLSICDASSICLLRRLSSRDWAHWVNDCEGKKVIMIVGPFYERGLILLQCVDVLSSVVYGLRY
jgi:hypothetical protein